MSARSIVELCVKTSAHSA